MFDVRGDDILYNGEHFGTVDAPEGTIRANATEEIHNAEPIDEDTWYVSSERTMVEDDLYAQTS